VTATEILKAHDAWLDMRAREREQTGGSYTGYEGGIARSLFAVRDERGRFISTRPELSETQRLKRAAELREQAQRLMAQAEALEPPRRPSDPTASAD
jgi:hypothetical protein